MANRSLRAIAMSEWILKIIHGMKKQRIAIVITTAPTNTAEMLEMASDVLAMFMVICASL